MRQFPPIDPTDRDPVSTLTIEQIRIAQTSDDIAAKMEATSAVIAATEGRLAVLAGRAARGTASGGRGNHSEFMDEFSQVGRIAIWEAIPRFKGNTVDEFCAFIYRTVEDALKDSIREERSAGTGADEDAVRIFGEMVAKAEGDVYLAERMAQTVPPVGRRLGKDRANAARIAWQGSVSLSACEWSNEYVREAEDIHATYGVPEDLLTSADITRERDRVKHALVNAVLDSMSNAQAEVLRYSFGIAGRSDYGYGVNSDGDVSLAQELDTTPKCVQRNRDKALTTFPKKYIPLASNSAAHALELAAAAASVRANGRGGSAA